MVNEKGKAKATPAKATPVKSSKKEAESKSDIFVRLATQRVKKVLKAYRILGNCSSNNYEYNEVQINTIYESLLKGLETMMAKFTPSKIEQENFEL